MDNKYKVNFSLRSKKQLKKLDKRIALLLINWIEKNLVNTNNPRKNGKALKGNLKGLWRYRIGDYRLICEIIDNELTILIIELGNRKSIYKK